MIYFMGEFKKNKSERKRTLRDNLLGTTNSGRAFRIGSAISLAGLGTLGYKNKKAVAALIKKPNTVLKRTFTKQVTPTTDTKIYTSRVSKEGEQLYRKRVTEHRRKGLFGTKRDLKWKNVGKAGAIGGAAIVVPVGAAYVTGNKDDKERIKRKLNSVVKLGEKIGRATKSTINTLHKVSR